MEGLRIREYQHEDLEKALNMDGRPSERRKHKFALVESIESFYCYVAVLTDEEILGFVIMEDFRDGASHYMVQINSAQKRKGIGRQLTQKVFDRVGVGGHISLCVNTDNQEAIDFYEAMKFTRSGFTDGYRKNQHKYWYQKDLK